MRRYEKEEDKREKKKKRRGREEKKMKKKKKKKKKMKQNKNKKKEEEWNTNYQATANRLIESMHNRIDEMIKVWYPSFLGMRISVQLSVVPVCVTKLL